MHMMNIWRWNRMKIKKKHEMDLCRRGNQLPSPALLPATDHLSLPPTLQLSISSLPNFVYLPHPFLLHTCWWPQVPAHFLLSPSAGMQAGSGGRLKPALASPPGGGHAIFSCSTLLCFRSPYTTLSFFVMDAQISFLCWRVSALHFCLLNNLNFSAKLGFPPEFTELSILALVSLKVVFFYLQLPGIRNIYF